MATVAQILKNVALVLADKANDSWSEPELIDWLNNAILALIVVRPDAAQKNLTVQLVPGTQQAVPVTELRLLRLIRNQGANGTTIGKSITESDLPTQDAIDPGWHTAAVATEVYEFFKHPDEPRTYYVSPPVHGTTQVWVEASFATIPAKVAANTDTLPVDEIYSTALEAWILHRAFSADSEDTPNYQRSMDHKKTFLELLGIKQIIEKQQDDRGEPDAPQNTGN